MIFIWSDKISPDNSGNGTRKNTIIFLLQRATGRSSFVAIENKVF